MKQMLYLTLVVLTGVCGAVLRGMSLLYGYELESGLPVRDMPSGALIALTVVAFVACALFGRVRGGTARPYEQVFGGLGRAGCALCAAAGVGIALCSVCGLWWLPTELTQQSVAIGDGIMAPSLLIVAATALMWLLGVIAGVSLALSAVAQAKAKAVSRRTGLYVTLPMFWCCLDLILIYHENSGNPVISDYSYLLLLVIAIMAAFHSIGSSLFSPGNPMPRFFACAGIAVYLTLTVIGGSLLWYALSDGADGLFPLFGATNTIRFSAYACAGVYVLVYLAHALSRTASAPVTPTMPDAAGTPDAPGAAGKGSQQA